MRLVYLLTLLMHSIVLAEPAKLISITDTRKLIVPYAPYLQSIVAESCTIYFDEPGFDLFSETIQTHFNQALPCWKPTRGIPNAKWVAKEIKATWEAANRFFHGETDAPYLLFNIGLSEGGGHIRNNVKPGEKSFGWTCVTIPEAQRAARAYPDLMCPKKPADIAEKLDTDPRYCMLVTAAIIRLKMYENRGDFVVALMKYKYGDTGMGKT